MMAFDNTAKFLHSFFFGSDYYSADYIDKNVDEFVVQFSLDNRLIEQVNQNGKRMYHILTEGKKILKNKEKERDD